MINNRKSSIKNPFYPLTLVISILLGYSTTIAQTEALDSLKLELTNATLDTNKILILNDICSEYWRAGKYDTAVFYAEKAKLISSELIKSSKNTSEINAAKKGLAKTYNTFGNIYSDKSIYTDALQNYFASLKLKDEVGDKKGIASTYNNIGIIYRIQENYSEALKYYRASLKIKKDIADTKGVASSYNNIGNIYLLQNDFSNAINNYKKALEIFKELNFKAGITSLYNNIGSIYYNQSELISDKDSINNLLQKAHENYVASLKIFNEIADKRGVISALINISTIELKRNNIVISKQYAMQALSLSKIESSKDILQDTYHILRQIADKEGNVKLAYEYYQNYILYRDSLFNEDNSNKITAMQMQFEFDKKSAADSLNFVKEQLIKEVEIKKQKAEINAKKNQQYALFGGLVLVLIFAGLMYNRFKVTQKQKIVIEDQKLIVEEKNREITDSIYYAKRIQAAILPPLRTVKEYLPQSFIVYKPKDIVAGDFYWMEVAPLNPPEGGNTHAQTGGNVQSKLPPSGGGGAILFAACDCTGHGVPGAMVSVVCVNGLNRSVREHGLTDPGQILDKTREIVIQEFEKSDDVVKDGMDIALCSLRFDVQGLKLNEPEIVAILQYAGANNPLWIIRPTKNLKLQTSNFELLEYKADKQHIGKMENPKPFTTHTIEIKKNDSLYIFTDGYQDQFGGENGKKFKSSKLKELLISINDKEMIEQQEIISQTFENWKGSSYQIDDVCIIGVKI